MRMTHARRMVLTVMLSDPEAQWYGYDLAHRTGLGTGTVAPMLVVFLAAGLMTSEMEDPEAAHTQGRPPRRLYRLNSTALPEVRQMVAARQPMDMGAQYRRALAVGNGELTTEQADAQRFDQGAQMLRERALAAMPLLFVHLTAAERQELAQRLAVSTEPPTPDSGPGLCGDEHQPAHPAGSHPEDCRTCSEATSP